MDYLSNYFGIVSGALVAISQALKIKKYNKEKNLIVGNKFVKLIVTIQIVLIS